MSDRMTLPTFNHGSFHGGEFCFVLNSKEAVTTLGDRFQLWVEPYRIFMGNRIYYLARFEEMVLRNDGEFFPLADVLGPPLTLEV